MKQPMPDKRLIVFVLMLLWLLVEFLLLQINTRELVSIQPGIATLRGTSFCKLEKNKWVKIERPKPGKYEAICGNFLLKNSQTELSVSIYKDKKLVDYFEGIYEEGDIVFDIRDDYPAGTYRLTISHYRQVYQRITLELSEE